MINYEHIYKGTEIINEFHRELLDLCERYRVRLEEACPENISTSLPGVADNCPYILLGDDYTKEQLIEDGFDFKYKSDCSNLAVYTKLINGVDVEVTCTTDEE